MGKLSSAEADVGGQVSPRAHDSDPLDTTVGLRRMTYTVEEAATLLGISRSAAYESVKRGEIPARKFGRRIVVPRAVLESLLGVAQDLI